MPFSFNPFTRAPSDRIPIRLPVRVAASSWSDQSRLPKLHIIAMISHSCFASWCVSMIWWYASSVVSLMMCCWWTCIFFSFQELCTKLESQLLEIKSKSCEALSNIHLLLLLLLLVTNHALARDATLWCVTLLFFILFTMFQKSLSFSIASRSFRACIILVSIFHEIKNHITAIDSNHPSSLKILRSAFSVWWCKSF